MKQIIKYIFIGILAILLLPFLLLGLSDLTGIGKKDGGFKTYDVFSPLKEGQSLIVQHKIKCVAKDVECLAFIDIKIGETFFAYNIDHNNYYFTETLKCDKVPEEISKQYQFSAHFTWLDMYGRYLVYGIYGVVIIGWILFWFYSRK